MKEPWKKRGWKPYVVEDEDISQSLIQDYIKKLMMLEKQVGYKTGYKILKPFYLDPGDVVVIQDAAKKIAEFIGLQDLTFIVATAKQEEKVGGHVELEYGQKEVFVEIADNTAKFGVAVLATLAHEITHKYLQINGFFVGTDPIRNYENEVLTDIATVFLGLGKLMLTGCEVKTTTERLKSGYLDRKKLAFVYQVVCAMRGISRQDMISGLSVEAIHAICACDSYRQDYFNPQFRTKLYRNGLEETLGKKIQSLQHELNQANSHLEFLKEKYIRETEEFLKAKHKKVASLLDNLQSIKQGDVYDPCLLFLDTIELRERIDQLQRRVEREISDTMEIRQSLNELTKLNQKEKLHKPTTLRRIFPRIFRQ